TFTGRVDDATLFSALCTADICVNPDRPNPMNDMSTMNKIMEYMALGKPIVQFDLTEGRTSAGEPRRRAAPSVVFSPTPPRGRMGTGLPMPPANSPARSPDGLAARRLRST